MKILFIDTETGGLSQNSALIQLSGIVQIDKTEAEVFNFYVKPFPNSEVTDVALAIQNRTREEVETFEDEEIVFQKFISILNKYVDKYDKNDKFILAGYNINFDKEVLNRFFRRNKNNFFFSYVQGAVLDPLYMITPLQLLNKIPVLDNNKLETWCEYFNISLDAHDSLEDIKATKKLARELMRLMIKK